MSTAHRPTWSPAIGKAATVSRIVGNRELASETRLKFRAPGQGTTTEIARKDLKLELMLAERDSAQRKSKGLPGYAADTGLLKLIEDGTAAMEEVERMKRRKMLAVVGARLDDDDEDKDDQAAVVTEGKGKGRATSEDERANEDEDDEESDSDDDEDETAELLRELEKIKRERAEERERVEREKAASDYVSREEEIATGNPLLNLQSALNIPGSPSPSISSSSGASGFGIKRRWDDDVIFKNQARGTTETPKNEFVNDLLRSQFHKRFMNRKLPSPFLVRHESRRNRMTDPELSRRDSIRLPYQTSFMRLSSPLLYKKIAVRLAACVEANDKLPRGGVTRFHAKVKEDRIDMEGYILRLMLWTPYTRTALLLACYHLDRITRLPSSSLSDVIPTALFPISPLCSSSPPSATTSTIPTVPLLNSYTLHRLLLSTLLVSAKFISDEGSASSSRASKVGGVERKELLKLELAVLELLEWGLGFEEEELERIARTILATETQLVSASFSPQSSVRSPVLSDASAASSDHSTTSVETSDTVVEGKEVEKESTLRETFLRQWDDLVIVPPALVGIPVYARRLDLA